MLRAFVDESAGSSYFNLSGYLARAEKWEEFSEEWQAILNQQPSLSYFKMRESFNLTGQFQGHTSKQRDERLANLIQVIKKHVSVALICIVSETDYKKVFVGKLLPPRQDNPYSWCFYNLIISTLVFIKNAVKNEKVDFIFDEHKIFAKRAMAMYWHFKKASTDRELVGLSPGVRQTVKTLFAVRWNCIVLRRRLLAKCAPAGEAEAGSAGVQPAKE